MLQYFQTLAKLPRDVSTQGDPPSATVYSLACGRKRKRSELAIAIDTEGVSLYDIPASKRLTSYSVSPQASFTCPPSSVWQKRPNRSFQRTTYCSVYDPSPRLHCFIEDLGQKKEGNGKISVTSRSISGNDSKVVFLEAVENRHSNGDSSRTLLVVHEDGEVRLLSENLSVEYWTYNPGIETGDPVNKSRKIKYATAIQPEEAFKGLLKNREDLVAILRDRVNVPESTSVSSHLLFCISELPLSEQGERDQNSQFEVSILCADLSRAEQLGEYVLPASDPPRHEGERFSLHIPSGVLYSHEGMVFRQYDLTGLIPRLSLQLLWKHRIHSLLRISSNSVVLTSGTMVTILNTKYQAILASTPLSVASDNAPNGFATRRSIGGATHGNIQLLSYFVSQGVVVAIQGRSLCTIQVSDEHTIISAGTKRTHSGRLINVIGRGIKGPRNTIGLEDTGAILPVAFGKDLRPNGAISRWEAIKAQLNVHVKTGDTAEYDAALLQELNHMDCNVHVGCSSSRANPMLISALDFTLRSIFTCETPDSSSGKSGLTRLAIRFHPIQTIHWFISRGFFSLSTIESALRRVGSLLPTSSLRPDAVVTALVEVDPSLRILQKLLAAPNLFSAEELGCVASASLRKLRNSDISTTQLLISHGNPPTDGEFHDATNLVNVHTNLSSIAELANKNEDIAHTILRQCMDSLFPFHGSEIRSAFHREFSHEDLLLFVDIMRMILARGGWLSQYVEDGPTQLDDGEQISNKMSICAKLLNCAIDSLGTSGWIGRGFREANTGDTTNTIAHLKAEVSAALEGVEEAAYLKAMLNEVLLYSKAVRHWHTLPGTENLSTTKPIAVSVETWEDQVLPIGLKANQSVDLTKVGAGGEIKERSMRDVGMLKSRKVGAYSFERILI